jgi:hypothetical protein
MTRIPKKIFALFGEFIHEFNFLDFQCKSILVDLFDDKRIGHILVMHQNFDFVIKRVDKVFELIIDDPKLRKRWKVIYPKLKKFQELRNDVSHSHCDINPENKNEFILTRFSEKETLRLTQKSALFEINDLTKGIRDLKKINLQVKHLFHSTFIKHTGVVFVRKKYLKPN